MYIDLGTNAYDLPFPVSNVDGNSTTGIFTQFGFTQMLATSIYELNRTLDGLTGSFYDTNSVFELSKLYPTLPTTGTAMDGVTQVTINLPTASGGQQDLDSLAPMVLSGPAATDSLEGFGLTWRLMTEYHFDGVLGLSGPNYTGGYFNIYFDDLTVADNDRQVLGGTLTSSQLQAANLNLFFDITMAETGFLFIDANSTGNFVDAATLALTNNGNSELRLDTNVDPPIPSPSQLLAMYDGNTQGYAAVRQTTLDGSISPIPEPGTLALFGAGLLGLGFSRRRKV
jgi:hypothetical protein